MANISKQDLQGARTPADLERKYNFGKSFAEIMGFAEQAQRSAEEAQSAVDKLDETLTQEEMFKRLTNNGEAQGIFRGDDGEIYINAEYIVSLSKMFANDIVMTGTFTNTTEAYVVPGEEEMELLQAHIIGGVTIPDELIPLYDFNSDGLLNSADLRRARLYQLGLEPFSEWAGAVATTVTMTINLSDPSKAIHFTGTNMWGREFDGYLGVNFTSARCPETEARIDALEARIAALENA